MNPTSVGADAIRASRQWSLNQDLPFEVEPSLLESIDRFSVIHPPILRKSGEFFEIICGAKRIAAAAALSLNPLTCLVIDASVGNSSLLPLIAEDQTLSGPLSPIQTARLIVMANTCSHHPSNEWIKRLSGISSITRRSQLTRLLSLDEAIRTSIHAGSCSVQTGLVLHDLPESDRSILFGVITGLSLNANRQRRVIELSRIVAANRQCSIGEVFLTDYPELLDTRIDNIPQKTASLMKDLFRLSHPLSSRAEERFNERVKGMKLPDHFRITHSPSFEQDTVTLEIDFPRWEDFEKRWEALRKRWG